MAFHDWNGDGKRDIFDDFIEYQIYKDINEEDDETDYSFSSSNKSSKKSSSDSIMFLKILLAVIWAVYILTSCQEIFH